MMTKSGTLALVLAFLLAAAAATAAEPAAPAPGAAPPPKPLAVGDKIAKVALTDLDGNAVEVAVDKGLVALTFFNSACSACKAEMRLVDALAKQNKGLKVVAVSVDAQGAKTTKPFIENNKFGNFEFYIDPQYTAPEKFGFSFSPSLVVIKDGSIALLHAGFLNKDEELLTKMLLK